MRYLIIGGGAGGASAAARLRRNDEKAEIIIFEKGQYVSYANCGLPYYIGGKIKNRSSLSVQTPESLKDNLNIDVRTGCEVISVDTGNKYIKIKTENNIKIEKYNKLIIASGAKPYKPSFISDDIPGIFTLRDIPDTYKIHDFITQNEPKSVLIAGGGFIGLEMAENLKNIGINVTVAELSDHVVSNFDADMAEFIHNNLKNNGISLMLNSELKNIEHSSGKIKAVFNNDTIYADMIILSMGVKPDTEFLKDSGIFLDQKGAILVNEFLQTSDPNVFAVGDSIITKKIPINSPSYIPLAGPANKQGRLAADNITGAVKKYKGSSGTSVLKLFDMTFGSSGINEKAARAFNLDYDIILSSFPSHAAYYPGSSNIYMKILFEKANQKIIGAQLAGYEGTDKRLDIFATAIYMGLCADDLAGLDLAYAPPFSSAKDPVNMAGFMIQNIADGKIKQFRSEDVDGIIKNGGFLLDVRTREEYKRGNITGSVNIPLQELRTSLDLLDKNRHIYVHCQGGQRSYYACRILMQNGYDASHLAGGYRMYSIIKQGAGK